MESFYIFEGDNRSYIFRDISLRTACHIMVPATEKAPQIVVAFPAGESAVSFRTSDSLWELAEAEPFVKETGLHGIRFSLKSDRKKIRLILPWTSLDNILNLRIALYYSPTHEDFPKSIITETAGTLVLTGNKDRIFGQRISMLPEENMKSLLDKGITAEILKNRNLVRIKKQGNKLTARKETLDGKNSYELEIVIPTEFSVSEVSPEGGIEISGNKEVTLFVSAAVDFPRPTPVPVEKILTGEGLKEAGRDPENHKLMRNFSSLVYKEKLLAGSWYYLVFFGRDTLNAARLMWIILSQNAREDIISSVLDRLADDGRVAVVEELNDYPVAVSLNELYSKIQAGDFAAAADLLEEIALGKRSPMRNYNVIDATFMLLPVIDNFLSETESGRIKVFLEQENLKKEKNIVSILKNINKILALTDSFTKDSRKENLIALDKTAGTIGNWRDSGHGLGWGKYACDVNSSLALTALYALASVIERCRIIFGQACLESTAKEHNLEHLNTGLAGNEGFSRSINAWEKAIDYFVVSFTAESLRDKLKKYIEEAEIPEEEREMLRNVTLEKGVKVKDFIYESVTPESLKNGISFPAISLDEKGEPIGIMHSDEVYSLLDRDLSEKEASAVLDYVFLPYPAGLYSDIGMLITNPIYLDDKKLWGSKKWEGLNRRAYHGAVAWGWPMRALVLGLSRQLEHAIKSGFSDGYIDRLKVCLDRVLETEKKIGELANSELWTWEPGKSGRMKPAAFGQGTQPSTPVQLWSGSAKSQVSKDALSLYKEYRLKKPAAWKKQL